MRMVMDMQVEFSDEVLEKVAEKLPEVKVGGSEGLGAEGEERRAPNLVLRFEKFGGKIALSSKAE